MAPSKTRSSPRRKLNTRNVFPSKVTVEPNNLSQSTGKDASQDIIIKRFPSLIIKKKSLPKSANTGDVLSETNSSLNRSSLMTVIKLPSLKADTKIPTSDNIIRKSAVTSESFESVHVLPQDMNSLKKSSVTIKRIKSSINMNAADDEKSLAPDKNKKRSNSATTTESVKILPHCNGQINKGSMTLTLIKPPPALKTGVNQLVSSKKTNHEPPSKSSTPVKILPQDPPKRDSMTMTLVKLPPSSKAANVKLLSPDKNLKKRNRQSFSKSVTSIENLSKNNSKLDGSLLVMKIKPSPHLKTPTSDNVKKDYNISKSVKSLDILSQGNGLLNGSSMTVNSFPNLEIVNMKAPSPNKKGKSKITPNAKKSNSLSDSKADENIQHSKPSEVPVLKTHEKCIPIKLQKVWKKTAEAKDVKFKLSENCPKRIKTLKLPLIKLSGLQNLKTPTVNSSSKSKPLSPVTKTDNSLNSRKTTIRELLPKKNQQLNEQGVTLIRLLTSQDTSSPSTVSKTKNNSNSRKGSTRPRLFLKLKQPISNPELSLLYFPTSENTSSSLPKSHKTYSRQNPEMSSINPPMAENTSSSLASSVSKGNFSNSRKTYTRQKPPPKRKEPTDNAGSLLIHLPVSSSSRESISQIDSHESIKQINSRKSISQSCLESSSTDVSSQQLSEISNPPLNSLGKCIPDNLLMNTELSIAQFTSQDPSLLDLLKKDSSSILRERKNEVNSIIPSIDDTAGPSSEVEIITLSSDESSVEDEAHVKKTETETTVKSNRKRSLSPRQLALKEKQSKSLKLNDENSVPANGSKAGVADSETSERKCETKRSKMKKKKIRSVASEKKKKCETVPAVNSVAEIDSTVKSKKKKKKEKLKKKKKILDVDSTDPDFEMVNINLFFRSGEFKIPCLSVLMQNASESVGGY